MALKARVTIDQRIDPKLWAQMRAKLVEEANELIRKESTDVMYRATNMMLLAMAMEGLSPKTGERVRRRLEDTVVPMWNRYIKPDEITGKGDGDFAITHQLEERGYPFYQPVTEM